MQATRVQGGGINKDKLQGDEEQGSLRDAREDGDTCRARELWTNLQILHDHIDVYFATQDLLLQRMKIIDAPCLKTKTMDRHEVRPSGGPGMDAAEDPLAGYLYLLEESCCNICVFVQGTLAFR